MNQTAQPTVNQLNQKAMDLAHQAVTAEKQQLKTKAKANFKAAFEAEKQAALTLMFDFSKEPSRSILFRSAAFLAIKAELYREAERMAAFGLCGNPPDEIAHELRDAFNQSQQHLKLVA